jgi:hypothetical protein
LEVRLRKLYLHKVKVGALTSGGGVVMTRGEDIGALGVVCTLRHVVVGRPTLRINVKLATIIICFQ